MFNKVFKAVLAMLVTLFAAFLALQLNYSELAAIAAVTVMGGFIIFFNETKK